MLNRLCPVIVLCVSCQAALAVDRLVPQQYSTIQAAINAAQSGDLVVIAAGVYPERLRIVGKAVSLQGAGQEVTVVDGLGIAGDFLLVIQSDSNAPMTVSGLTFQNSPSNGLVVQGSSGLEMHDCTIQNCSGTYGAALICNSGSAQYRRVTFRSNSAVNGGAVNTVQAFQGAFIDCIFDGNQATNAGAAIIDFERSSALLRNCVFKNHTVGNSVVFGYQGASTRVESNRFCSNTIPAWSACCGAQIVDLGGNVTSTQCVPTCRNADLLADRNVNGTDLGILLAQWGPNTQYTISDINSDGVVDGSDLGLLLSFWGPCPY